MTEDALPPRANQLIMWIYEMEVGDVKRKPMKLYNSTRQRAWQYGKRFDREYSVNKLTEKTFTIERKK